MENFKYILGKGAKAEMENLNAKVGNGYV